MMTLLNALLASSNLFSLYAFKRHGIFKHGLHVFETLPLLAAAASFCYHLVESPPLAGMNDLYTSRERVAYIVDLLFASPTAVLGLYCFVRVLQLQRKHFKIPLAVGCRRHTRLLVQVFTAFLCLGYSVVLRDSPHHSRLHYRPTMATALYILSHSLWHCLAYDAYYQTLSLFHRHALSAAKQSLMGGRQGWM